MNFEYLSVQTLIRINAAQDGDVGVRDIGGVEANAARPQSEFGGQETFPDVWTKAAAYAHAIASTQYFHDGNKRTAWLAANIFLDAHGFEMPAVPDIEAEAFINAVALDAWKADGARATVDKAAEWFRHRWESEDTNPPVRQAWGALCIGVLEDEEAEAVFDVERLGLALLITPSFPALYEVEVLVRLFYVPADVGKSHKVDVAMEYQADEFVVITQGQFPFDLRPPAATGHPHHKYGILPTYLHGKVMLGIIGEGTTRLVVTLNGSLLTKIPLTIRLVPNMADDELPDWLTTPDPDHVFPFRLPTE